MNSNVYQYKQESPSSLYKTGMVQWCRDLGFNYTLTLAWNRDVSLAKATVDVKKLHAFVDEKLLGRYFYKLPVDRRTRSLFVFESVDYNLHVHSLWNLSTQHNMLRFHGLFPGERGGVWNKIVPSGSYKLRIVNDIESAVGYTIKQQHPNSDDRLMVLSDEFYSRS